MSGPGSPVDYACLAEIREAMKAGAPWIVLRLTKSGRYQATALTAWYSEANSIPRPRGVCGTCEPEPSV